MCHRPPDQFGVIDVQGLTLRVAKAGLAGH